ncbi:hypothetical protein TR51_12510 [Kitasatospora griseola]|uniref:Uncharacterized protein n=1 Tax=Kitasatospora griseola TaxID=2064 RepID=A0A0D0P065_KITGR|nr:hypothetical protein [Kitasatospora griseola]KIQ64911.1 hypothetical protein TR51_12510 [Kitasatospora griseola]
MPARNRLLPRGLSWPLTPTDIRSALAEEDGTSVPLDFGRTAREDGVLLTVEWVPQIRSNYGGGIHPTWWETYRIQVAPLPSARRAAARQALRTEALPALAAWIAAARAAPEGWRSVRHSRSWQLAGDGVVTWLDDGR